MVEIFKDIRPGDDLFANFSLIAEAELPGYTRLVGRLDRTDLAAGLSAGDRNRLLTLALRLVPARHRLGTIDEAFMAKVVAARVRFRETLPPALAGRFGPFEPDKRTEMHQRLLEGMKGRTVVAVVERLDLARLYDRVVVLDAGKVVEVGTYQELTGRPGLLQHLLAQAGLTG